MLWKKLDNASAPKKKSDSQRKEECICARKRNAGVLGHANKKMRGNWKRKGGHRRLVYENKTTA